MAGEFSITPANWRLRPGVRQPSGALSPAVSRAESGRALPQMFSALQNDFS
jgi:hypothetical protein